MSQLLDIVLVAMTLSLAVWTVMARDVFSATVGFMAFGLLLAIIWVQLAAPDVAMTEAAIGAGASGVLFLRFIARRDALGASIGKPRPDDAPVPTGLRIACGALCGIVAMALGIAVLALPSPAPSLAQAAAASLPRTGLGNPIAAVLMAYRALDTLLESVVLVLALIGIWSLSPDSAWGSSPDPFPSPAPAGPLTLFARLLPPVGIIVGIHLTWIGATAPGGKFQGATVLAAMWLLAMMAGLARPPAIGATWLRVLLAAGPTIFLAIGFSGWLFADAFLAYTDAAAKPIIVLIEAVLTPSIAAILAMMLIGPPALAHMRAPDT